MCISRDYGLPRHVETLHYFIFVLTMTMMYPSHIFISHVYDVSKACQYTPLFHIFFLDYDVSESYVYRLWLHVWCVPGLSQVKTNISLLSVQRKQHNNISYVKLLTDVIAFVYALVFLICKSPVTMMYFVMCSRHVDTLPAVLPVLPDGLRRGRRVREHLAGQRACKTFILTGIIEGFYLLKNLKIWYANLWSFNVNMII